METHSAQALHDPVYGLHDLLSIHVAEDEQHPFLKLPWMARTHYDLQRKCEGNVLMYFNAFASPLIGIESLLNARIIDMELSVRDAFSLPVHHSYQSEFVVESELNEQVDDVTGRAMIWVNYRRTLGPDRYARRAFQIGEAANALVETLRQGAKGRILESVRKVVVGGETIEIGTNKHPVQLTPAERRKLEKIENGGYFDRLFAHH